MVTLGRKHKLRLTTFNGIWHKFFQMKKKKFLLDTFFNFLRILSLNILTFVLIFLVLSLTGARWVDDAVTEATTSKLTKNYEKDVMVQLIYNKCVDESTDLKKVYCVHNIFSDLYEYDYSHMNDTKFREPTSMFIKGGVCRDSAMFFKTVFDMMNITSRFEIFGDYDHIINIVDLGEGDYCIIDQTNVNCY